MRNALPPALLLLPLACIGAPFGDGDPVLDSIELSGIAAGQDVRPGTRVEVVLRGRYFRSERVAIEVLRVSDGGGEITEAVDDVRLRDELATYEWDVQGDFLREAGRHEIFFRASHGPHSFETDRFVVESNPTLTEIRIALPEPGRTVGLGDEIRIEVTGEEVWGQRLDLTASQELDNGTSLVVRRLGGNFDDAETNQLATIVWTLTDRDFTETGTRTLSFAASFGDLEIESPDRVAVAVDALLDVVEMFPEGDDLRIGEELVAIITGQGLEGRTLSVSLDDTSFEQDVVATGDRVEVRYTPTREDFGTSISIQPRFRVALAGSEKRSSSVKIFRAGIDSCTWLDRDGQLFGPDITLDTGIPVILEARTWGYDDEDVAFEIFEDDPGTDDSVGVGTGTVRDSVVTMSWTTTFFDDGALQSENEFYFTAAIGELSCKSGLIDVRE